MLDELKKLVIAQKTAALPFEPPSPELEALHDAVTRYDQLVSLYVIQAIQGASYDYPSEQVHTLRSELDRLFAAAPAGRDFEIYRRYRHRLDQMSDLAEQAAANPTRRSLDDQQPA